MKYLVFIVAMFLFSMQCYSQSKNPKTSDKAITSSTDTLKVGSPSLTMVHISLTNIGMVDTLLWRTNYETTWSHLFPNQSYHEWMYADTIFRKSSGVTGMYSQLEVK
jgi:hypothetical protein